MHRTPPVIVFLSLSAITTTPALAQDAGQPPPEVLGALYPGAAYSPYADRSFPSRVYDGFRAGGQAAAEAAFDLISNFTQGTVSPTLVNDYAPGSPVYSRVWDDITKTAESFNEPGVFTALIGG